MSAFLVAFAVALAATPTVVWFARRLQLLDHPNHRSLHVRPVPRGGGVAVAMATVVGLAAEREWPDALLVLAVGSTALAAVGLLDDRRGLPPLPRLAAQLLVPLIAVLVFGERGGSMLLASSVISAFLVAGYVNAFNFMDGINGISGTSAVVVGVFLAIVAHGEEETALSTAGLALSGGALGFLPYNVPRAVIFLGDVGSYFMGAWLAGLALLVVESGAAPAVVLAPFLLYLLDTTSVLVKRARRGDSLMEAHREHAYQRLVALGWTHVAVAGLNAAIAALCAGLALAVRDSGDAAQAVVLTVCTAIVGVYLALPAMLEARSAGPS